MVHIFLLNPISGFSTYADDLRSRLEQISNITYYIFNIRYEGYEAEAVKQALDIFDGEKLRFYVCGGAATFNKVMNAFPDLETVEVAYYPCGTFNNFIYNFGDNRKKFFDIASFIKGDVVDVDYIKTNHGLGLNSFSVGMDTDIVHIYDNIRDLRRINKYLPYRVAAVHSAISSHPRHYEIYLDTTRYDERFSEVIFGNGCVIGDGKYYCDSPNLTDGKAEVVLFPPRVGFGAIPVYNVMRYKDMEALADMTTMLKSRHMHIESKNGKPVVANIDGILYQDETEWEVEIVPKGLHLIVPKGVKL